MKNKSGILASMLCLTMLSGLTFTEPTYAADLDLTFDYHDLNTINSWFQPWVQRRVPGQNFAWTAIGSVYYGSSGQPRTNYWDSGALLWYNSACPCQKYKAAYISGAKIRLYWVTIAALSAHASDTRKHALDVRYLAENNDVHMQEYTFGDVGNE